MRNAFMQRPWADHLCVLYEHLLQLARARLSQSHNHGHNVLRLHVLFYSRVKGAHVLEWLQWANSLMFMLYCYNLMEN